MDLVSPLKVGINELFRGRGSRAGSTSAASMRRSAAEDTESETEPKPDEESIRSGVRQRKGFRIGYWSRSKSKSEPDDP